MSSPLFPVPSHSLAPCLGRRGLCALPSPRTFVYASNFIKQGYDDPEDDEDDDDEHDEEDDGAYADEEYGTKKKASSKKKPRVPSASSAVRPKRAHRLRYRLARAYTD